MAAYGSCDIRHRYLISQHLKHKSMSLPQWINASILSYVFIVIRQLQVHHSQLIEIEAEFNLHQLLIQIAAV